MKWTLGIVVISTTVAIFGAHSGFATEEPASLDSSEPSPPARLEAEPGCFCWSADDLSQSEGKPPKVDVDGLAALRFDAASKTCVDLSSRFSWDDLSGPLTVRIVFQPTRLPGEKTPLLSKWHMKEGGRSFELGVLTDGRPYLDVSPSGNWDSAGRELAGSCRILPGNTYAMAAVFIPGSRMSLLVNGHPCGELREGVPEQLHKNDTPVILGAQPPGKRWANVAIARLLVDRRVLSTEDIGAWSESLGLTELPTLVESPVRDGRMDLATVRRQVLEYCSSLQVEGEPCGTVRNRGLPEAPATLYATCDLAWIRACMGEDLVETLASSKRQEWIDYINSFALEDGTYPGGRHSLEHANGMVIGALAVLGGRQKYPVSLYDEFDGPNEIEPWLEKIQWQRQWGASHLFWGGMHCFSMSAQCGDAWRGRVLGWLDENLDAESGWWRKGVPQASQHIEVLGGAAHIWPIYQHHQHPFPYPRQVIDSILAMQQPDGSWLGFGNYMELDALYGLAYMHSLVPAHRADEISDAAVRHGRLVQQGYAGFLSAAPHAHSLLAVVGTLALLQELDSDHFRDDVRWSDIFSDRRFYRTDRVECVPAPTIRP